VQAFFDLFDNLFAEGFKVSGIAGRDDALVNNDLTGRG
jgi:hypothetical protein